MPARRQSVSLDASATATINKAERRASIKEAERRQSVSSPEPQRRGSVAGERRQSVSGGAAAAAAGGGRRASASAAIVPASPFETKPAEDAEAGKGRRTSFVDSSGQMGAQRRNSTTDRRGNNAGVASNLNVGGRGAIGAAATLARGDDDEVVIDKETTAAVKALALQEFTNRRIEEITEKIQTARTMDPAIVILHTFLSKLRDGHTAAVYAVQYSADGSLLLTSGHDGSVVIWDTNKLEIKRKYSGHTGPVFSIDFWPQGDNEHILSAGEDGTVRLWHKKTGKQMYQCTDHKAPVYTARYSRDGSLFATAGDSHQIVVYDNQRLLAAGKNSELSSADMILFVIFGFPTWPKGHSGCIRTLVWTEKDKFIISGGDDRNIRVWEVASAGKHIRDLTGHAAAVHCLAIMGNRVASGSADSTARIWNWKTGVCLHVLRGHTGTVYSVAYTPEGPPISGGRRLITASHDRTIMVWESATALLMQKIENAHKSWVLSLAVRADGLQFASASGDQTIGLWAAQKPTCFQRFSYKMGRQMTLWSAPPPPAPTASVKPES